MPRLIALFCILISVAFADTKVTPENLTEGELFKGSTSSQGVGLYCVHHGGTTITSMVLMHESKDKVLATIPARSIISTDKKHKNWLSVKWNAKGTMVAIHDALNKHSKVFIYRLAEDGSFHQVALPDMLKLEAGGRLGIDVSTIKSSGQEPDHWRNDNVLMVKYRFRTNDGKLYRRTLPICISDSGENRSQ